MSFWGGFVLGVAFLAFLGLIATIRAAFYERYERRRDSGHR